MDSSSAVDIAAHFILVTPSRVIAFVTSEIPFGYMNVLSTPETAALARVATSFHKREHRVHAKNCSAEIRFNQPSEKKALSVLDLTSALKIAVQIPIPVLGSGGLIGLTPQRHGEHELAQFKVKFVLH